MTNDIDSKAIPPRIRMILIFVGGALVGSLVQIILDYFTWGVKL